MNNELGRKITSITIMAIMLAGGLVVTVPGAIPTAAAANPNLFVSAENSQFSNYMSGPQVIEVVVIDSSISDTDQGKGEPDVTVNGKDLRMVQATDGNWYGYFADRTMAQIADSTAVTTVGDGLDFGQFCEAADGTAALGFATTDSVGFAVSRAAVTGGIDGSPTGAPITPGSTACAPGAGANDNNVVREAKVPNNNAPSLGQIGLLSAGAWPFIQLYSFNPTGNVVIQYNKGGNVQSATLTFDTVEQFAKAELDRAKYTQNSQVYLTITDLWLNIDPTDEDSWTFAANKNNAAYGAYYQVFNENGGPEADANGAADQLSIATLRSLMCEDNCQMTLNANVQGTGNVITIQDNDDSDIVVGTADDAATAATAGGALAAGTLPITITELGPKSGIFGTYDESDVSALKIISGAKRGTSASLSYVSTNPVSILVGNDFATIDIKPTDNEWNSGEEIPITLVDADANKNSRADEDLDLNNPNVDLIPSLQTGDPFTLGESDTNTSPSSMDVILYDTGAANVATQADVANPTAVTSSTQAFSFRSLLTPTAAVTGAEALLVDTNQKMSELLESINQPGSNFRGYNLVNNDLRSITNQNVDVYLVHNNGDIAAGTAATFTAVKIAEDVSPQSHTLLNDAFGSTAQASAAAEDIWSIPSGNNVGFLFVFANTDVSATKHPVVADMFSFGFKGDGQEANQRVANQIVRLELEETGDNTSTFEGTLEYVMINQLNILDAPVYSGIVPISDQVKFIVMEDLDDEESPRVNYLDLGADGVSTQVADQQEAPSHSGKVSLNAESYKVADTVNVTVEDQDLNVDSDLIDIYTVVSATDDPAFDAVGEADLPSFGFGPLGRLLDITFDDIAWKTPQGTCSLSITDTGLGATGFTLRETGVETGIFVGDFQIPTKFCPSNDGTAESTTGLDLEANYVDYRDASGEIVEVGDSAGIRANTGSISLDRTVYPVPFGIPSDFATSSQTTPEGRSVFPIHQTGMNTAGTTRSGAGLQDGEFLNQGDLIVHIRVNDPDYDISASGEDTIAENRSDLPVGPVAVSVLRGSETVILGFAGGPQKIPGTINVGTTLIGDGQVSASELTVPSNNNGFQDGEIINILQSGVVAADQASLVFTNAGPGLIQASELSVVNNQNGFTATPVDIIITQGASTINGIFTDLNGDSNLDTNEITLTSTGGVFVNGNNLAVTTATSTIQNGVTVPAGTAVATLAFTDDVDTIDAGELGDNNDAGSTYKTGQVTLVGAISGARVTATFTDTPTVRQFGPMVEIAPNAGIFEFDLPIRYTDGPSDTKCPETLDFTPIDGASSSGVNPESDRFNIASPSNENYCILQGDILQVEYTDPTDSSGDENTVTDSATFDLRNGVLQSDKSVYIIGSDMILTLIEPDFDLDNDSAETYDLDLIEWDSDAATVTMGNADGQGASFDPEPTDFRETGDSTGIFQVVAEIPASLDGDNLERGEEIVLEYTDWGPSGSDYVGDEDEDVNLTIFTSNFGATVELDQKVYSWTDKVYITIVAPDHNFDSKLIDEIGNTDKDPIKVSTRGNNLNKYKLVETGTDTGIFTGEVILTGFKHDADGDASTGDSTGSDTNPRTTGSGPTGGFLEADDDDGITVSFEFSEDETIVGSALIRWNIGEVQWLEASYPAVGTGVVRVIDPDMNLDPEAVDNFNVDVWSDSDAGGIDLTVTETNEATGIFEGTVFFTTTDESSGHRLRVAEGDTVTADYQDNTLPNPYTTADELDIEATSLIGTIVPPLERAPASNLRVVDAFGNSLSKVSVDQQVQITADLANGQDREQAFAYLVQIQDSNGVTVSLAWITGSLSSGQSFSPALSWIPTAAGTYTATAFVWESVDNPTALSPPVETTITVS